METFVTLFVIFAVIYFAGKLILRRAGRPVTKVYNIMPPAIYQMPQHYNGSQETAYTHNAEQASGVAPNTERASAEYLSEEQVFDGIVREYYRS